MSYASEETEAYAMLSPLECPGRKIRNLRIEKS